MAKFLNMDFNKYDFEKIVKEGISAIPEKFFKMLSNVEIVIEKNPNPEQLKKLRLGQGYQLFGLYEGIPKTKRWSYGQVLPDKITIFQEPIERVSNSEEEIKEIVKNVVWHEIAHHFGIDEKRVRTIEKTKNKKIKNNEKLT
jgi:predicted Zn-dependent protease with MMP-like domain